MKRIRNIAGLLLTLALVAALAGYSSAGKGGSGGGDPEPPQISFFFTYLETLGGDYSLSHGMNNKGDVVGLSETEVIGNRRWQHAFNVDDGSDVRQMIELHDVMEDEDHLLDPRRSVMVAVRTEISPDSASVSI